MQYFFFWNGPFSNWDHSPFTIDGIDFNCGEQYMMYHKSLTCGDIQTAVEVMMTKSPSEQKKLGRQIKNYDEALWSEKRQDIVKAGLKEKFLQNSRHMKFLKKHKGKRIVEASPEDRVWGIGYASHNAMENIDDWGTDILGKIITELSLEITD